MTPIHKDYLHLSAIFLNLLSTNKEFKSKFQEFTPAIYGDIESLSINPNCSCRMKVENYILSDRENFVAFLNKFLTDYNVEVDLSAIEALRYSGTIKRVKLSEWSKFVQDAYPERHSFKSFSILKVDDENVDVFFI